jgi:hypothetical protein
MIDNNNQILYLNSVGQFMNYSLAKAVFDDLKSEGIEKVEIMPYLNGTRIQANEIEALYANYPDLKKYLESYKN